MEVFLEIFEGHFVFVDLGILKAVFDFVEVDVLFDCLKHPHDILRNQITLFVLV